MAQMSKVLAGAVWTTLSYGAGLVGVLLMGNGPRSAWYRSLRKPAFQPPGWVFGPVWNVLYGAIAYSAFRVWRAEPSRARTIALALWGTQVALNAAWTPMFFGARAPRLALADIILLDATASAYTAVASRVDRTASLVTAPYLGWLGFATTLNASIAQLNPTA
jgi:tryptophan-rich sensory protein